MVDILDVSGARRPRPGLAATPTSTLSGEQLVRPYTELARAVGALGETLEAAGEPAQAAEGAKAVSKDADGNLQVQWRAEFSRGDKLYNAAARQAALASGKTDIDNGLLALRNQFDGKPAEYAAAAKSFVKEVGKGGDALLRPFLQAEAEQQSSQHFRGLLSSKHDLDLRRSLQSLTAREGLLAEELEALASQGGSTTAEFQRKRLELDDIRSQKAANPKLAYTPEQRAVDDQRLDVGLKAAGIVGIARRDYERDGDLARAQRTAESALDALPIPPAEKLRYLGQVSARLSGQHALRQAEIAETKEEAQSLAVLFGQGQRVDLKRYDEVVGKLRAGRAYAAAYNLEAAKVTAEARPIVRYGSAADAAAAIDRVQAGAGAGGDYLASIRAAESGGDDAARNPRSTATGRYQFTEGTWATLMRSNPELGLTPAGRLDPAQQERAIRVFTAENAATLRRNGLRDTNQNLYAAHFLGSGGAVEFVKGAEANPDAQAAALVGPGVAVANREVFFRPDGTAKSAGEVYAWMGRKAGGSGGGGNPMLPEVVKALQATLNERTKETWASVRKALDDGLAPSGQEVDDLRTLLPKVSDADLRKEIASRLGIEEAKQSVAGMPLRDRENLTAVSREAARQGNASAVERDIIAAWEKQNDELRKVMAEEPTRYGAVDQSLGLPVPRPLDLSSADGFRASLGERQIVLGAVKQLNPEAPDIVLDAADRAQLGAVLAQADAPTATMLVGTIAQLPPAQRGAVMADGGIKDALVGMSRSGDPGKMSVAFTVLDAERRRDPIAFGKTFGPTVEDRLEEWTARMSMMPVQDLARELTQVDDPARMKARDALRKEATAKVGKVTVAEIAGFFDTTPLIPFNSPSPPAEPLQAGTLKADFDQEFARFYAVVGDEGKARELAVERLKRVWAPSALNGGRLTKFAPERSPAYPPIDGSQGWLVKQLDADVRAALGRTVDPSVRRERASDRLAMTPEQRAAAERTDALLAAPRMLVPDARTEAEFNSGRPPSYPIVVQAPNGMFMPLQDSQGRSLRFVGDFEAAMAGPRAAAESRLEDLRAGDSATARVEADAIRRRDARNARRSEPGR
ncbi:lytic transglycosylase domain-containing protein [Bosea sp. RAC05]|uniref:lytic transglycosylase domain-containing protein n=1 Tax=Bosea sp. RAC05 TaxID=1842539 RepID=UPI00083DD0E0|nr:hypothetical protein [Bosea sp. RAC05]AOG07963.1 hypothetical protein BSY19_2683 [Bosea sp. RAC05]